MVTTIHCDVCNCELKPKAENVPPEQVWNQIILTQQGSLDLCPDDLSLFGFIIDRLLGDKVLLEKFRKEWEQAKQVE